MESDFSSPQSAAFLQKLPDITFANVAQSNWIARAHARLQQVIKPLSFCVVLGPGGVLCPGGGMPGLGWKW
jgi:hypothetical protein